MKFWRFKLKARLNEKPRALTNPKEHPVAAANWLWMNSIVERLDLAKMFPNLKRLRWSWAAGMPLLAEYARRNFGQKFHRRRTSAWPHQKLDRKVVAAGLTNLRGVRIESAYFLQYLCRKTPLRRCTFIFRSWPKKKHRRPRLINEGFPALAALRHAGGVVYLRTDDTDYFTDD